MIKIDFGTIKGDDGLIVKMQHNQISYIKRGRCARIAADYIDSKWYVSLSKADKWVPEFSNVLIDERHKAEIFNDLTEALTILGINFVLE